MINLHTVQLATATLRTTHVTTCVELLPRRYSRASDGQDSLERGENGWSNFLSPNQIAGALFWEVWLVGPNSCTRPSWKCSSVELKDEEQPTERRASAAPLPSRPQGPTISSTPDATGRDLLVATRPFHNGSRAEGFGQFAALVLRSSAASSRVFVLADRRPGGSCPSLRVSLPHEVEAMLSVQFSSRPPCGPSHTNCCAARAQWSNLESHRRRAGSGHGSFSTGRGRHLTNSTVHRSGTAVSFFLGDERTVTAIQMKSNTEM